MPLGDRIVELTRKTLRLLQHRDVAGILLRCAATHARDGVTGAASRSRQTELTSDHAAGRKRRGSDSKVPAQARLQK